jgi:hypothetical protein
MVLDGKFNEILKFSERVFRKALSTLCFKILAKEVKI